MMRCGKWLAACLVALLVCTSSVMPAYAALGERYEVTAVSAHNNEVHRLKEELEEKYQITIEYPVFEQNSKNVSGIYVETLHTLDTALSYVTPYVVQQVSAYYQRQNGRRLRFIYQYSDLRGPYSKSGGDEVVVGGFSPDESMIVLHIPNPGEGATITGDAPLTIVHEFGHAVQLMITDQYGYNRLEYEWTTHNKGYAYAAENLSRNPDDTVFMSGYGATSFDEDFAELFAHAYVCNRAGTGLSGRLGTEEAPTPLREKLELMYELLGAYFADSKTFLENFQSLYDVPVSKIYNDLKFTGPHMQFMDYEEPRYMPITLIKLFQDIDERSYVWHPQIGAWIAWHAGTGNSVIIFPDGTWGTTCRSFA